MKQAVEWLPNLIGGKVMGKKTRYRQYAEKIQKLKSNQQIKIEKSTSKSVLQKLKELKGQEFRMTIPIGGSNGE